MNMLECPDCRNYYVLRPYSHYVSCFVMVFRLVCPVCFYPAILPVTWLVCASNEEEQ